MLTTASPSPVRTPLKFDPSKVRLEQSANPSTWLIAEYEPGKRITQDMVHFDLDRADVHVNAYGVVHFYNAHVARALLGLPH